MPHPIDSQSTTAIEVFFMLVPPWNTNLLDLSFAKLDNEQVF
jgi:hypothetical protein